MPDIQERAELVISGSPGVCRAIFLGVTYLTSYYGTEKKFGVVLDQYFHINPFFLRRRGMHT